MKARPSHRYYRPFLEREIISSRRHAGLIRQVASDRLRATSLRFCIVDNPFPDHVGDELERLFPVLVHNYGPHELYFPVIKRNALHNYHLLQ